MNVPIPWRQLILILLAVVAALVLAGARLAGVAADWVNAWAQLVLAGLLAWYATVTSRLAADTRRLAATAEAQLEEQRLVSAPILVPEAQPLYPNEESLPAEVDRAQQRRLDDAQSAFQEHVASGRDPNEEMVSPPPPEAQDVPRMIRLTLYPPQVAFDVSLLLYDSSLRRFAFRPFADVEAPAGDPVTRTAIMPVDWKDEPAARSWLVAHYGRPVRLPITSPPGASFVAAFFRDSTGRVVHCRWRRFADVDRHHHTTTNDPVELL